MFKVIILPPLERTEWRGGAGSEIPARKVRVSSGKRQGWLGPRRQ